MINTALIGCGYWGEKLRRYIDENQDMYLSDVGDSQTDLDII